MPVSRRLLPAVSVDTYNEELRDDEGFVGDRASRRAFRAILAPTLPLSRHIFEAPTRFYKAGIVFLAWLNGHQDHFAMLGGLQSSRSAAHYAELFRLADQARILIDPERAAHRTRLLMGLHGIDG